MRLNYEALKQLLRYMEESRLKNAVNDNLEEMHRMVEVVKTDSETSISCVRRMEKLERSKNIMQKLEDARCFGGKPF